MYHECFSFRYTYLIIILIVQYNLDSHNEKHWTKRQNVSNSLLNEKRNFPEVVVLLHFCPLVKRKVYRLHNQMKSLCATVQLFCRYPEELLFGEDSRRCELHSLGREREESKSIRLSKCLCVPAGQWKWQGKILLCYWLLACGLWWFDLSVENVVSTKDLH